LCPNPVISTSAPRNGLTSSSPPSTQSS
jgi:hypothetical protein